LIVISLLIYESITLIHANDEKLHNYFSPFINISNHFFPRKNNADT